MAEAKAGVAAVLEQRLPADERGQTARANNRYQSPASW
jgi:hypothetical protein